MRNLLNTSGKIKYTECMSFFVKNDTGNQHGTTGPSAATQKFLAEFSAKVNDEAQAVELTNLCADKACLEKLGLTQWFGRDAGLWGLLVFCKKGLYFYVHETESAMFNMLRKDSSTTLPEQLLSFTDLPGASFALKPHTFWSNFDADYKHTIVVTVNQTVSGTDRTPTTKPYSFILKMQHNADAILQRIYETGLFSTK